MLILRKIEDYNDEMNKLFVIRRSVYYLLSIVIIGGGGERLILQMKSVIF